MTSLSEFGVTLPHELENLIWSYVIGWETPCHGSEWCDIDHATITRHVYKKKKTMKQLQRQREKRAQKRQRKQKSFVLSSS